MKLKSKVGLGALTTGLLSVSVVTGTILANQGEEEMEVLPSLEDGSSGDSQKPEEKSPIKPAVAVKKPKRGNIKRSQLKDSESGKSLESVLSEKGTENECKNRGGKWKDNKCTIPSEIEEDVTIEPGFFSEPALKGDQCYEAGGYYKPEKEGECWEPGTIFKPELEVKIENWKKHDFQTPESTQKSLSYFHENGFMELREKDNQFAVVFLEDKLGDEFDDWKFPNHLKKDGNGIAMKDVCEWANKVAGDHRLNTFLYNEKTGIGWHCLKNSRMFFVEKG